MNTDLLRAGRKMVELVSLQRGGSLSIAGGRKGIRGMRIRRKSEK
jgi:hypothetical protein